jgi:hypothetical protein
MTASEKMWFVVDRRGGAKHAHYSVCYAVLNTVSSADVLFEGVEAIVLSDYAKTLSFKELLWRYKNKVSFELRLRWKDDKQQAVDYIAAGLDAFERLFWKQ